MHHRLCGLSTYGLNGLEREMSTPPTLRRGMATLPFFSTQYEMQYKQLQVLLCGSEMGSRRKLQATYNSLCE